MTAQATQPRGRATGRGAHPALTPSVRVAVYCRKSVDKGDSGVFGSIDAQRSAVEGYVLSQAEFGWVALAERYDDLGESGATTKRPAFQRLLADVELGKVDLVAVYRLDRLSRSQRDFVELMDFLDRHGVTFVSVTERFDTTTPHGRFALGLSMQVAQLERETTAERVRDKVLASRRRGLWTGGNPPLGYDVVDRALVINAAEAEQVREILAAYLRIGSLARTASELNARGFTTKTWTTKTGKLRVGSAWTKNSLSKLLTSPIPAGMIAAEGEHHDGQHEAIVDRETWDAVRAMLAAHRPERRRPNAGPTKTGALLQGLLRCGQCGESMGPHSTQRHGRRYVSYVCQTVQKQGIKACPGSRAPSHELDGYVVDKLSAIGKDPALQAETARAARDALKERRAELKEAEAQARADLARLEAERARLSGNGPKVAQRLVDLDEAADDATQRLQAALAETQALTGARLRKDDLRDALGAFMPLWEQLFPAERRRIIALAIERVAYDARAGALTIDFRLDGIEALAAEARQEDAP